MTRTDVLNTLCAAHGYRRYLEIGVRDPSANFLHVRCASKVGIDPALMPGSGRDATGSEWQIQACYSDNYYGSRQPTGADIVFVDGDHRERQVDRDVRNALDRLAPGGSVVMHDCLPQSLEAVAHEKPDNGQPWNGTAYLVWLQLCRRPDLLTVCVDCDHGMGVIQKLPRADLPTPAPRGMAPRAFGFAEYLAHQHEWSHVVTPDQFLAMVADGRL